MFFRGRRGDRGAASVEFALVLPILMLLIFGVISFGMMLAFRQAVSQSAAEGARAAAVAMPGTSDAQRIADATAAINDSLSPYGVTCSGGALIRNGVSAGTCAVAIKASCSSGSGECAEVTLDYHYSEHSMLPAMGFNGLLPDHLRYVSEVRVS